MQKSYQLDKLYELYKLYNAIPMTTPPKLYLAPFQGITGQVFRSCYAKHFGGVDKLFTPYFTSINHDKKLTERKLKELSPISENGIPVIPQILSKDADEIIRFAALIGKLGYSELNWNLGCPFPQVASKKRGSGMLPYPVMVADILESVFQQIEIPFSIKCRTGYFSSDEMDELVPVFNRFPLSELIIHPRIGTQLYKGKADTDKFAGLIDSVQAPLTYNGDIFCKDDYILRQQKFQSVSRWMLGRGLLSDPFLAAKIKGLELPSDLKITLRKFTEDLYLSYRRSTVDSLATIGFMKEYWLYLSESFHDPHQVMKKIRKVKTFDEYEDALKEVFEAC